MVDELKAVVIGCGNMGTKRIKSLIESKSARLIMVSDNDSNQSKKIMNGYGVDYCQDPYETMDKAKPDFVIISTPNKFHAPLTQAALRRGIHVICEKPLARNPQEALMMVKASIENKTFLKTGSNLRYFPSVIKAKELLDRSEIGDVYFLRGWIGNSGWHLDTSWNSWFSNPDLAGGGTMLDNGAHMFDLVRWFLGEAKECLGSISTMHWRVKPLEDVGFSIIKTVDRKIAFIQSSWIEWAGYMYMEVYGANGYIRIDNRENACKTVLSKNDGTKQIFDYSLQPPVSYRLELEDFINCLRLGQQPLPSGYDGFRAIQIAFGIYKSSKTGRSVTIYGKEEEELANLHRKVFGVS